MSREGIADITNEGDCVTNDTTTKTDDSKLFFIRQGDPKDGYAQLRVLPDNSSVLATFYPPSLGGAFLTYGTFAMRLEELGINTGIFTDVIQESIFTTNSTHKPLADIVIAHGKDPITEIPEHFVMRKDLIERKPEIDPNAARIDWHSISAFTIVKKKDPIARRIAQVEGQNGTDVYGSENPFSVQQKKAFSAGENIIDHPSGLFAAKDGRLSIDAAGRISIEEVLVLKKGVDFTTGNIIFPGDIILQGKIADGFKIYSGGSIISADVVDATEIVCKKDMIVQGGVEGKSKGTIRVGGNLTAKYIQNCRVAVRGDIIVSGSIVQSRVYTMGEIKMGDTGKLIGCECIVIGGIQALDIGNARGSKTYLRCGTDFTVQQELDIANEQLKAISLKLEKAEDLFKEEPLEKIKDHIDDLRIRKLDLTNKIAGFLPRIDKNDAAFIEVRGSVYPGTEIEICHVPYSVTKIQKQVVFRLDKTKGAVVSEPYKKS